MTIQMNVGSFTPPADQAAAPPPATAVVDLLRQILEVQREQLAQQRAAQDVGARWRAFLERWRAEFPELPEACREALPIVERAYVATIAELAEHVRQQGSLDNDFAVQEFLDRYGMRLTQLGTLLGMMAPLVEGTSQGESA